MSDAAVMVGIAAAPQVMESVGNGMMALYQACQANAEALASCAASQF